MSIQEDTQIQAVNGHMESLWEILFLLINTF